MRPDKLISNKEFIVLLVIAGIFLISVLMRLSLELVTKYNESVRSQQTVLQWRADGNGSDYLAIDYEPKIVPLYHLLAVFLFLRALDSVAHRRTR